MPWKEIKGRPYWYTSRRIGDRVVSEYGGRGLEGELWSMLKEEDKEVRRLERERRREERSWYAGLEAESAELAGRAIAAARSYLGAMGYHRRWRQWRRERGFVVNATDLIAGANLKPPDVAERVECLLDSLDITALANLAPGFMGGEVQSEANREKWTQRMIGDVNRHASELLGPGSAAGAERVLAVTAGLVFLELRLEESRSWSRRNSMETPLALDEHEQRRVDRLRRRYASLIKTLAEVRKLTAPLIGQIIVQNNARGGRGAVQAANIIQESPRP